MNANWLAKYPRAAALLQGDDDVLDYAPDGTAPLADLDWMELPDGRRESLPPGLLHARDAAALDAVAAALGLAPRRPADSPHGLPFVVANGEIDRETWERLARGGSWQVQRPGGQGVVRRRCTADAPDRGELAGGLVWAMDYDVATALWRCRVQSLTRYVESWSAEPPLPLPAEDFYARYLAPLVASIEAHEAEAPDRGDW